MRVEVPASVRTRLSLLVLIALIPVLALVSYTAAEQRRVTLESSQDHALQILRMASTSQQHLIESTRFLLTAMAQLPEVQNRDVPACKSLFRSLVKQDSPHLVLGVVALDGRVVCSVPEAVSEVSVADRTYFRLAAARNAFAVGEYQIGRIIGKATLNCGYPVRDEAGSVVAVIYAALDLAYFDRLVSQVSLPEGAVFTLMDRNGTVLARHPAEDGWIGKRVPEASVAQGVMAQRNEGIMTTGMPIPTLYAFSRLPDPAENGGLWVSLSIPTAVLFRNANRLFAGNIVGLVIVAALAMASAWVGGEFFILRYLRVLVGATERLAAGDLSVRTGLSGGGEFGLLARTFDRMAEANAALFRDLERSHAELARAYDETLEGWVKALDLRDHETEGHSRRVADMTMRLATALGMSGRELASARRGAFLHDIGKIGIPDGILLKPGPLTEREWEIMRQHPVYARKLLEPISYLKRSLDIPYYHHERWDGGGYPEGVRKTHIPLIARAFAVADVYDALRSERPYRPAWTRDETLKHISEQAGSQFDPGIVGLFLEMAAEQGFAN